MTGPIDYATLANRQPDTAMSTPKKKPARKAKPAKNPAARPIPPPPPGWEIVGKDDPRLKNLPCRPMAFDPDFPRSGWSKSGYDVGDCITSSFRKILHYALSPPMIRLRLPSEKPTREDGDRNGNIIIFERDQCYRDPWHFPFVKAAAFWLPGRLPDGILPREPSQEENWRAEFEEKFSSSLPMIRLSSGVYENHETSLIWTGFLAARKGGAE